MYIACRCRRFSSTAFLCRRLLLFLTTAALFFVGGQIANLKNLTDFSVLDSITGMTGLHYSAMHGHTPVVEYLVHEGEFSTFRLRRLRRDIDANVVVPFSFPDHTRLYGTWQVRSLDLFGFQFEEAFCLETMRLCHRHHPLSFASFISYLFTQILRSNRLLLPTHFVRRSSELWFSLRRQKSNGLTQSCLDCWQESLHPPGHCRLQEHPQGQRGSCLKVSFSSENKCIWSVRPWSGRKIIFKNYKGVFYLANEL